MGAGQRRDAYVKDSFMYRLIGWALRVVLATGGSNGYGAVELCLRLLAIQPHSLDKYLTEQGRLSPPVH